MLESWFASSLVLVIMCKYLSNIRYTHTLKHIRQANVPHGADDADTAARGDKLGVGGWAAELKLALRLSPIAICVAALLVLIRMRSLQS